VDLALEADLRHPVAGAGERIGIGEPLVAQRIEPGGQQQGRRQVRQVGVQQRRSAPVEVECRIGDVVVVEVADRVACQQIALAKRRVRWGGAALVGRRVDQQLKRDLPVARVACRDGHHRGEVAAGAVAADREPRRIDAERGRMALDPSSGGDAVVDGGWKAMLRPHPVVDRHHRAARAVGELAAQGVVGVEVADDPAPAVKVDERRQRRSARARGPVRAQGDRPGRPFGAQFDGARHLGRRRLREEAPLAVRRPRFGRCERVQRRHADTLDQLEQGFRFRVEHGLSPYTVRAAELTCGTSIAGIRQAA
jgi:hypothetical protein